MSGIIKLQQAIHIIETEMEHRVNYIIFEPELRLLRIDLWDETVLHIRYNNFEEYAYSVVYSSQELDRCRFDNYDEDWDCPSHPHHFHPRWDEKGYQSPMTGFPDNDITLFCRMVKEGKLLDDSWRF